MEAVNDYLLEESVVLCRLKHFHGYFVELLFCEVNGNDGVVHFDVVDSYGLLLFELYVLDGLVPHLYIAVRYLLYLLGRDDGTRVLNSLLVGVDDLLLAAVVAVILDELASLYRDPAVCELGHADEVFHCGVIGRDIG